MPVHRACSVALLLVCVTACRSAPPGPPASPAPDAIDCTLVLLKTGPRREPLPQAERSQVFGGHFGNMQRLAREGHLLVAGPYGKEKSDESLRGIFVLDTPDRQRARSLAETDPGFQAGVFAFDFHALSTQAPLRAFLAAELATQEEAARAGRTLAPGEGGRGYVLLTVEDGAAAAAALAGHAAVLWFARLDGSRAFVLLDAVDVTAARALLEPVTVRLGACRLDEWFGSGALANLPRMGRS